MSRTVFWFGEPWPQADYRAPVCEDERYHLPGPPRERCAECDVVFATNDRGLAIPSLEDVALGTWRLTAYHLKCWLIITLGPVMGPEVYERALNP